MRSPELLKAEIKERDMKNGDNEIRERKFGVDARTVLHRAEISRHPSSLLKLSVRLLHSYCILLVIILTNCIRFFILPGYNVMKSPSQ